ncbi:18388_t:CDS:2 [Rhizophagus irregularis]|nr:18388_t:CDS:2 [Rhizophagus irregularis]
MVTQERYEDINALLAKAYDNRAILCLSDLLPATNKENKSLPPLHDYDIIRM